MLTGATSFPVEPEFQSFSFESACLWSLGEYEPVVWEAKASWHDKACWWEDCADWPFRHTLPTLDPVPLCGTNAKHYEGIRVCCGPVCIPRVAKPLLGGLRSPGVPTATGSKPGRMEPWWISISIAPFSTEVFLWYYLCTGSWTLCPLFTRETSTLYPVPGQEGAKMR